MTYHRYCINENCQAWFRPSGKGQKECNKCKRASHQLAIEIRKAATKPKPTGKEFNISGPQDPNDREIIKRLKENYKKEENLK